MYGSRTCCINRPAFTNVQLQQAIPLINYALRGIDDDAPNDGTDEWNYWLSVLNRKKNELYNDVTKAWDISYAVDSVGTITASAAPVYNLDAAFISPSGSKSSSGIYVITTDGKRIDLKLVKVQERPTDQAVYIAGHNPKKLYFNTEIEADDPMVGGTLYVSGYYMPDDIALATDVLPFPDPYWGVAIAAAEIAGNDVTYEDKEANLVAKANSLYTQMVAVQNRGIPGEPRKTRTSVKKIRGF